ncbi:dTMP kinase [Actinomadura macrotermitis]|uniref:Thymidylate kinase n=1 Tax=Actinomadura macrotermitis TaxID=2585200 RepID=A0A7K0BZ08_9ACTN|nr:dTMP kinase [Actinomadura macrotermitis]MQY05894.1 Thymidylate kinase [Actinomadura macrotermitis]
MTRTGVTRQDPAELPGATSNQAFRRLRAALSLSGLGHWLSVPALTAFAGVLTRDQGTAGRLQAIGLVLVLMLAPAVLLAPLAGLAASRLDRRITMIVADVLRFALVASVPIVHALPWTMAAAFLVGCISLLWTPLVGGALPEEQQAPVLRAAYGTAPVAALLFTVLALISDALVGVAHRADLALYVTAVVFLGAAAAVAALRELPAPEASAPPAPLKLLVRERGAAGLAVAGTALAAGGVVALAKVHARELGGGDAGYGAILAALTLGAAFGLFLGPRVLAPLSRRRLLGLASVAVALVLLADGLVQNLVVVVVATAVLGVAAGIGWAAAHTVAGFGYPRAVALVAALVAVAGLPPLAGVLGDHRLHAGDGVYDLTGVHAALLITAAVALLLGLVACRRLDDRRGIPLLPDVQAALRGETYVPPAAPQAPAPKTERGVFVAFEGGEGAGKTTQARLAAIWLRDHGYDVVTTHEPGATKNGMRLRALLLDKETTGLSSRAETLLYAADRADHVANVIRPAMERGAIVVSDRYVDSSLAYQGYGRRQPVEEIAELNTWATGGLVPDLTVLLEVPPETGLNRLSAPADRIESEPSDFHERVREGFRALAEADPDRYLVLDASRPQHEITREIQDRIRAILPDPVPAAAEDITSTFPAITDA